MKQEDLDIFFLSPRTDPKSLERMGVLYLLRRDIDLCMGFDPNTGNEKGDIGCRALWPGAMAIMAGVDLLAKFFAGSDEGSVGTRFRAFLNCCSDVAAEDSKVVYQLRNSLLHSFGLYSEDKKTGKVYRFFLTETGSNPLVSPKPGNRYDIDLRVLHREFGESGRTLSWQTEW